MPAAFPGGSRRHFLSGMQQKRPPGVFVRSETCFVFFPGEELLSGVLLSYIMVSTTEGGIK